MVKLNTKLYSPLSTIPSHYHHDLTSYVIKGEDNPHNKFSCYLVARLMTPLARGAVVILSILIMMLLIRQGFLRLRNAIKWHKDCF